MSSETPFFDPMDPAQDEPTTDQLQRRIDFYREGMETAEYHERVALHRLSRANQRITELEAKIEAIQAKAKQKKAVTGEPKPRGRRPKTPPVAPAPEPEKNPVVTEAAKALGAKASRGLGTDDAPKGLAGGPSDVRAQMTPTTNDPALAAANE